MDSHLDNQKPEVLLQLLVQSVKELSAKLQQYIVDKNEQDKDQEVRLRILEKDVTTIKTEKATDKLYYERKIKSQNLMIGIISVVVAVVGILSSVVFFALK